MINRDNYLMTRRHMEYRRRVLQNDEQTVHRNFQTLKHLLQWADSQPFSKAPSIIPAFPEYIITARNDGKEEQLSPASIDKVLEHARVFFNWARVHEPGMKTITEAWISTIEPRRSVGLQSRLKKREYWSIEAVRKIAALKPRTLQERRDIAAVVFLFLSGMRIGAFVTLPLACIDLARRRIMQLPEKGVQTKNDKAAITFLLPIPDLLAIVQDWHDYLCKQPGSNAMAFYPPLTSEGYTMEHRAKVSAGLIKGGYTGRAYAFRKGLEVLCDQAGLPFLSAHKLRHGHGVYGVKKAKDIAQLKAISQNLMHANIGITDGIYGKLAEDDLADILSGFGE
jgi:integrase